MIRKLQKEEPIPYDLLLLADESKSAIDKYIFDATVFVYEIDKSILATYTMVALNSNGREIKNIAVAKDYQGEGIGTLLLCHAEEQSLIDKISFLYIGTGASSKRPLKLYRKLGFKDYAIIKNFFVDNYPQPIIENGSQLLDMLVLRKRIF